MAIGFGGHLSLILGSYKPDVICHAEPIDADPLAIRSLLTEMPLNKARTKFGLAPLEEHGMVQLPMGTTGMSDPFTQLGRKFVELTHIVNYGGRGIIVTVNLDTRTDVSSWYDIWAALHAITNLCIAKGHTGFARIGR